MKTLQSVENSRRQVLTPL